MSILHTQLTALLLTLYVPLSAGLLLHFSVETLNLQSVINTEQEWNASNIHPTLMCMT